MVSESLVKSCLYNWLGYGNINSTVWFIGIEEGGAEIWREKTQTLESSLIKRKDFGISMDFYNVWEDIYGINLNNFRGITVWHYIVSFILSFNGVERNPERIRDYIFYDKKLGRKDSDCFLCELLPLPKRSRDSIDGYGHIWSTIKEYHSEVMVNRFNLIKNTLEENQKTILIVSYVKELKEMILSSFNNHQHIESWSFKNRKYSVYKIYLNEERYVYMLSTPFFGQGQASYEGLDYAAEKVKDIIK